MRAQRYKQMTALRKQGLPHREIAAKMGVSKSYVRDLIYDPDGSKSRARKDSYRGICKVCGAPTDGSNGRAKAPEYCKDHANWAYFGYWTRSRIVAAIREWAFIYGRPPVATEWNRLVEGSTGNTSGPRSEWSGKRRWPNPTTVLHIFGTWANAIEEAGYPRPRVGYYRDESKRSEILTKKWSKESIIKWIQENAQDGVPPSTGAKGAPVTMAHRRFGSWNNAVIAAGFKPNRIARSTR